MINKKTLGRFISSINRGPLKNCKYIIDPRDNKDKTATEFEEEIVKSGKVFKMVVDQAYLDMCRTMKDVSTTKDAMLEKATSQLIEYFDNDMIEEESIFDGWHNETVNAVIETYGKGKMTIGQAQKIINMSFKYLLCFRYFREKRSDYFDYCHMPLDSVTLNWYKKEISNKVPGSWSKLNKTNDYEKIVKGIRAKKEGKKLLELDFEVWGRQKEKDALNELKKY